MLAEVAAATAATLADTAFAAAQAPASLIAVPKATMTAPGGPIPQSTPRR